MGIFKNKSSSALAMLGSIEVVNAIIDSQTFDVHDIELVNKDYATVDELIQGIKETKRSKYVFLSDTALIGIEDGKYEVIKQIREKYPDIIIAMFFNDERKDEVYKNWAFGYKVYHLYYADEEGGYNFEKIAAELAENCMPVNSSNLQQNQELEQKEQYIREKEKELADKELQIKELEKRLVETEDMEPSEENSQQVFF